MDMYKKQMENVPFGNSVFQNLHFGGGQESPARLYRNALLQLNQKLNVLQECKFRRERSEIDIEEIEHKLKTSEGFDRRRLEIDLREKRFQLDNELKLIDDIFVEVNTFKYILGTLPEFTREEFEAEEREYWKERLTSDARREIISGGHVGKGTVHSLEQIGIEVGRNADGQFAFQEQNILAKGEKIDDILCLNSTNKL